MKKLIIDGHNLIPKVPGLHLKDAEDEAHLTEIIQEYCRLARRSAELFFDGAPAPQVNQRKHGLVRVHFVMIGSSADDAIIQYVRSHSKEKDSLTIVSSDHRIQNAVLGMGCVFISSEVFARNMNTVFSSDKGVQQIKEKTPTASEVDEWMGLFNSDDQDQR
jgi:uncharacterized protein